MEEDGSVSWRLGAEVKRVSVVVWSLLLMSCALMTSDFCECKRDQAPCHPPPPGKGPGALVQCCHQESHRLGRRGTARSPAEKPACGW